MQTNRLTPARLADGELILGPGGGWGYGVGVAVGTAKLTRAIGREPLTPLSTAIEATLKGLKCLAPAGSIRDRQPVDA